MTPEDRRKSMISVPRRVFDDAYEAALAAERGAVDESLSTMTIPVDAVGDPPTLARRPPVLPAKSKFELALAKIEDVIGEYVYGVIMLSIPAALLCLWFAILGTAALAVIKFIFTYVWA